MIAVLTYDVPHRKTQDLLHRFSLLGREVQIVAVPWEDRKPRRFIYSHRPAEAHWPTAPIAQSVHPNSYRVVDKSNLFEWFRDNKPTAIVVGGAGIIDKKIVDTWPVLNVHPGLIPYSRGLDTLKWSLIEMKKVGVTAHLCDSEADLGWVIEKQITPVYHDDTFHAFAMRQYEQELNLFIPALDTLIAAKYDRNSFEHVNGKESTAMRRMPRKTESGLLEAFEHYKLVYA